jgi:hypothetical protein
MDMTTMVLRRVNVLSVAKWVSLPLAVMGVFAGIIYDISLWRSGGANLSLAIFYLISLPIEYAFVGFVGTAVTGLIYNSVAKSEGGIVLEFESIAISKSINGSTIE